MSVAWQKHIHLLNYSFIYYQQKRRLMIFEEKKSYEMIENHLIELLK